MFLHSFCFRITLGVFLVASSFVSSHAETVVVQPSIIAHPVLFGTYNAANSCNQVGLSVTYTSGTTLYSSYIAQNPVQATNGSILSTFVFTADNVTTGNWDYDLGASYTVKHFLFWNTQNDLNTYVKTFEILVSDNPTFTGATSAGTFTASPSSPDYPTPLETFDLNAVAGRYVRFKVTSNNGGLRMLFGEVAFGGDAVPTVVVPTVTTTTQSNVATTSATLGGDVSADGGASVTDRGIVWATTSNPTTSNNKVSIGSGTGVFSQSVTSLPASTTIYVRAFATNTAGTAYGSQISFTTLTPDTTAPTVVSVVRITPSSQALSAGTSSVTFRVTFSEAVQGVTAANFSLVNVSGSVSGTVGTPSAVSTSVYDVTVSNLSGSGEFRLNVVP